MDFNPSHEEQAQDRAYRIGQNQDVQVIRLVSQGTIEELKYVRQVSAFLLFDGFLFSMLTYLTRSLVSGL